MNIDIRLSVGFWRHPKVFRLEKKLGLKGVRSLQILWCWCAQNRPDGNLADLDASEIEFVTDWRGKKGAFIEACAGNWLDEAEEGYRLHEWEEYNPYQAQAGSRAEARKEKARNAANARWGKERANDGGGCSGDATSNAKKMPSLTSTSTKDIKESSFHSDSFCLEPPGGDSGQDAAAPVEPEEPPFILLPLNDKSEHPVFQSQLDDWKELYPAVDVPQQLRNMRGWLISHPQKRKTKGGINHFINGWLSREQDKGRAPSGLIQPFQPGGMSLAQQNYATAMSVIAEMEREDQRRAS